MNKSPDIASRKAFGRRPEVFVEMFVQNKKGAGVKFKIAWGESSSGWWKCCVVWAIDNIVTVNIKANEQATNIQ